MSDRKCARRLLEAADRDIRTLKILLADSPRESFGFHCQQAAQKALQAWMALVGKKYPCTHDIGELLDLLERCGEDTGSFRILATFTPYAVEFRYEGVGLDHGLIDREEALLRIEALVRGVQRRLVA